MQMHQSPEYGRDKAPLSGGGCNLFGFGVLTHRAFRLGRIMSRDQPGCSGATRAWRTPVLLGGSKFDTGRLSAQACSSDTSQPTRLVASWRGLGKSPTRTSCSMVVTDNATNLAASSRLRYAGWIETIMQILRAACRPMFWRVVRLRVSPLGGGYAALRPSCTLVTVDADAALLARLRSADSTLSIAWRLPKPTSFAIAVSALDFDAPS